MGARRSCALLLLGMLAAACSSSTPDPFPTLRGAPAVGSATLIDPKEDVTGPTARAAPPGVDLVNVRLLTDKKYLHIEFLAAGPIPRESGPGEVLQGSDELAWVIDTWVPEEEYTRTYHIEIRLLKTAWSVDVVRFRPTGRTTRLKESPAISGNRLSIRVPLELLADLGATFLWSSLTRWHHRHGPDPTSPLTAEGDNAPEAYQKGWRVPFPSVSPAGGSS